MNRVSKYLNSMYLALGDKLVNPNSIYYGREGHERFAREVGYALNDFNKKEQDELCKQSYSVLYVRGTMLSPILSAKEWIKIMRSKLRV